MFSQQVNSKLSLIISFFSLPSPVHASQVSRVLLSGSTQVNRFTNAWNPKFSTTLLTWPDLPNNKAHSTSVCFIQICINKCENRWRKELIVWVSIQILYLSGVNLPAFYTKYRRLLFIPSGNTRYFMLLCKFSKWAQTFGLWWSKVQGF